MSQMLVQLLLLLLIFRLIWRDRKRSTVGGEALDQLKELLERSSKLSAEFNAQLESGVKLVRQAGSELDAKIGEAVEIRRSLEASLQKNSMARRYSREDVIKLARGGYDVREIAGITELPVGEIELMISLDRQQAS